jgi:ABC-type transporter Mla subunit MlaD
LLQGQLGALLNSLGEVTDANLLSAEAIGLSAQKMQDASGQLGILSTNVQMAADSLASEIGKAMASAGVLADQSIGVQSRMDQALEGLQQVRSGMSTIVDTLAMATQHADSGFSAVDQHLQGFQKTLKEHVASLESELGELLTNMMDQVQGQTHERLNSWNEQTSEFTSSMIQAVRALQGVVDDMETHARNSP